jgi:hypothetical protein
MPCRVITATRPEVGAHWQAPTHWRFAPTTGHGDSDPTVTVAVLVAAHQTRADSGGVPNLKGPVSFRWLLS